MKTLSLTLIVILSATSAFSMNGNSASDEKQNLVIQYSETKRRLENLTATTPEAQDQRARAQERYHNLQARLHAAGIAYTGGQYEVGSAQ